MLYAKHTEDEAVILEFRASVDGEHADTVIDVLPGEDLLGLSYEELLDPAGFFVDVDAKARVVRLLGMDRKTLIERPLPANG